LASGRRNMATALGCSVIGVSGQRVGGKCKAWKQVSLQYVIKGLCISAG